MSSNSEALIVEWLASQRQPMIDLLRDVVNIDSGSYDKAGVDAVGERFQQHFAEHEIETWREPNDELEALLRRDTGDIQHAAGTCRMTGFDDASGVVNPDGTVKGISGLRVADASIMPSDCRANTHLTTVVIGEYIAKMMKQAMAKQAQPAMAS